MSCLVPCRADRQWLVFGNSNTWYNNNDQAGRAASASPPAPRMQSSPPGRAISKLLLLLHRRNASAPDREREAPAGGQREGWVEKCCNGEPRSCELGVLHLRLRLLALHPGSCESCRLLPPISTSEPLLPLRGAASCVSSRSCQCRDFQALSRGLIFSQPAVQSAPCCPPIDGLPWVKDEHVSF